MLANIFQYLGKVLWKAYTWDYNNRILDWKREREDGRKRSHGGTRVEVADDGGRGEDMEDLLVVKATKGLSWRLSWGKWAHHEGRRQGWALQ